MRNNIWTEHVDNEISSIRNYMLNQIESCIGLDDRNNADYFIGALGIFEGRFGDTSGDDTDYDTYLRLKEERENLNVNQ